MNRFCFIVLALAAVSVSSLPAQDTCNLSEDLKKEIQGYQPIVNQIVESILNGQFKGDTHRSLADFTTKFGARLAGEKVLENSIDYLMSEFKTLGLHNSYTEEAVVPHWQRGQEKATLLSPRKKELPILGLGTTIGTPKGGLTADVVVVETFDELRSLPDEKVQGKIVVFAEQWMGTYGNTVAYRSGAGEAAKKGAIATLIRSVTQFSIASPHTGGQNYIRGVKKIPTACLSVEDALMLLRMYREGETITIHLEMEDYNFDDNISRNTIVELPGSLYKNTSVVVVSGHLDSWDVGFGAMDDAGGCWISWKAVEYLTKLGLAPKRTVRAILWTAEEEGYYGAISYRDNHKAQEKEEFNLFMESDTGTFDPIGLDFSGTPEAQCIFKEILSLMTPIGATEFKTPVGGGPDISVWTGRGFPGASLMNKNDKYFWFHHTQGDSMLVEDPDSLDRCTALFAATAYVVADLSIDLPKDVK
ncbi:hypothetical protein ACFFRR_002623 [Megaselia abdita]